MQLTTLVRRIRGTVSTALAWSVVWAAVGAVVRFVTPYEDGSRPTLLDTLQSLQSIWFDWAPWGAIGGGIFAMCLAVDQTRSVRQLSVRRAAVFGTLAGMIVPVGFLVGASLMKSVPHGLFLYVRLAEFAVAGGACAWLSVVIAKRAVRNDGADGTDTGDAAQLSAPSFDKSPDRQTSERTRGRWLLAPWRMAAGRRYSRIPSTSPTMRFLTAVVASGVVMSVPLTAQTTVSAPSDSAWITSASGLRFRVLRTGTGDVARAGQSVTIHEVTSLTNGVVVFSSYEKNTPITFLLGGKQVIAGVDEGVRGMRVGERRLLEVPPALSVRSGYPPNTPKDSTLRIDIELVGIRTP